MIFSMFTSYHQVQKSDIERLVNLSSSFTSRFLNTSNTFCTDEVTGSGSDPASVCRQQSQAAANESTSCPMNAICASVPCGLDITTSSRMDADGRVLSVSKLTICKLSKLDEGALSCVAVNNISNVILTPEASAANLIVQGNEYHYGWVYSYVTIMTSLLKIPDLFMIVVNM